MYSVNGPEPFGAVTGISTQGLVIDIDTGNIKSVFNGAGEGFQNPHDLAVSEDGSVLYEAELRPFRVWKLTNGENGGSKEDMKQQDTRGIMQKITDGIWGFLG